jgi:hypothetical protein
LARIVPGAFTLFAGGVTAAAWLGLLGPDASTPGVRWGILGAALLGSAVQYWYLGRFRRVWIDGDLLIVGDPRRGIRVQLRDVVEVEESRLQKIKSVKLRLSRPTPIGDTIRFIPRGREGWLLPWLASPVAAELRERVESLHDDAPHEHRLGRRS